MKASRASALGAVVALLVLSASVVWAQCNLPPNPPSNQCAGGCAGGCAFSAPVGHPSTNPCAGGGGSLSFVGTEFENACSDAFGLCGMAPNIPPMRFWAFDDYDPANSGCQLSSAADWMANAGLDIGLPGVTGKWVLVQANWQGPDVDGCFATAPSPSNITVVEASWTDTPSEGTVNHNSWYLVGGVPAAGGAFDLDTVRGGQSPAGSTACAGGDIPSIPVPALTIQGRTAACIGNATQTVGTANGNDPTNYFDVTVNFTVASPWFFTDAGFNTGTQLIAGYEVMYASASEPTTSALASWTPARNPANPTQALGTVAFGNASASVSLPVAGAPHWLATRIVYTDGSLNQAGSYDPGTAANRVTTQVSQHCGPVAPPGGPVAVDFGSIEAVRTPQGVRVRWTTLKEEDTNGFTVFRSDLPSAPTESSIEAVPWVPALGAYTQYEEWDSSVAPSDGQTWYYYIQEITSSGYGSRSQVMPVYSAQEPGTSGGRTRTSTRR